MKKTRKLVETGEKKVAEQQLQNVYKALDKAAKRNVIHPNKAARMKSQLTKKVNNIGSPKASRTKSSSPKKRKTKTAGKATRKTTKKRKATTKRKSSKAGSKKAK